MKLTKTLILTIILAATLFACEDTVYPDPAKEPVKVIGESILSAFDVTIMSDGTIAHYIYDDDRNVAIAKINRNGKVTMSETISAEGYSLEDLITNSYGEMLVMAMKGSYDNYNLIYDIYKFDTHGHIVATYTDIHNIKDVSLLDNGDILYVYSEKIENTEDYFHEMRILGSNFTYPIEDMENCDGNDDAYATSYEDKIIIYNYKEEEYFIYKTDGTLVNTGSADSYGMEFQYLDGFVYRFVHKVMTDTTTNPIETYKMWYITKMDTIGNQIFETPIKTHILLSNLSIYGDLIIAPSIEITDYSTRNWRGVIYLLDKNDGTLLETISLEHDNCKVTPIYVSPDKNGEFDVYAMRFDKYDDTSIDINSENSIGYGNLLIYHTKDLHNLQME